MALTIQIDITPEVEAALRSEWGNLDQAAKESLLIESYRTGRISIGYLGQILGGTRWDAERWLAARGVQANYDAQDLRDDRATLKSLDQGHA